MGGGATGHEWEEIKHRFPKGRVVTGTVSEHHPFGLFVDLGDPAAKGLVQITVFADEGRMTPEHYPPVGMSITALVLGHTDERRKQVCLSVKPSQLKESTKRTLAM